MTKTAPAALARYRRAYLALETAIDRAGQIRLIAAHKAAYLAAVKADAE